MIAIATIATSNDILCAMENAMKEEIQAEATTETVESPTYITRSFLKHLIDQAKEQGIQKFVVGGVIVRDGKFLLLERATSDFMGGLIELPSGGVKEKESLLGGLEREVLEETGLHIEFISAYLGCFDYLSKSGKKSRQFNFLVQASSDEIVLNPSEHQAFYLISLEDEDFARLNISAKTKAILQEAFSCLITQKES
jgi:8-oxo-dGTP diphosphatase